MTPEVAGRPHDVDGNIGATEVEHGTEVVVCRRRQRRMEAAEEQRDRHSDVSVSLASRHV
jgi:hypothetical protein